ncbi:MAG: response regulator transcription factor [Candidatus Latescibacteria bacterium]|nr:response regulator transcription factor [Candidatus Latescibacterota bacterium]
MNNILVIDDDRELCTLLIEYLVPEGFNVEAVYNGEIGIQKVMNCEYNIVVLDIMLPGGYNGFDILQRIRSKSSIPVIMLTARGDDVDRIVGLEMGADDYLPKPFNPRELLARIHAILRRSRYMHQESTAKIEAKKYSFGDLELDSVTRIVLKEKKQVHLTNVEFSILEALMRNRGNVVSRDELANEILYRPLSPFDRSVDVHVSRLRKKLGNERDGLERIQSIRGVGYIFVCSSLSAENDVISQRPVFSEEEDSHG